MVKKFMVHARRSKLVVTPTSQVYISWLSPDDVVHQRNRQGSKFGMYYRDRFMYIIMIYKFGYYPGSTGKRPV